MTATPSCRAGRAVLSQDSGSEPAAVPPSPAAGGGAVPGPPAATQPCCRCVPPLKQCGQPTHPTVHGPLCAAQRDAAARARAAHQVELRAATSGLGVPTWQGGAA
jgi:hypothetical protein